jgi:hypothetical protein
MRSIYGFILLSGLLLTGVANSASRTVESGSVDRIGSDITSNILAENDGNFCKRGADQRDGCLERKSPVFLSAGASIAPLKSGVDKSGNRMHRGSGRIDTIDSETDNLRMSSKEDARGSGRREITNSDKDADSAQSNSQQHRGSGRLEA